MSGVVVVGVDGSPSARKAAEVALGLAKALGGSLHIVTAFDVDRSETFGVGSDEVKVWTPKPPKRLQSHLASHGLGWRSATSPPAGNPLTPSSRKPCASTPG